MFWMIVLMIREVVSAGHHGCSDQRRLRLHRHTPSCTAPHWTTRGVYSAQWSLFCTGVYILHRCVHSTQGCVFHTGMYILHRGLYSAQGCIFCIRLCILRRGVYSTPTTFYWWLAEHLHFFPCVTTAQGTTLGRNSTPTMHNQSIYFQRHCPFYIVVKSSENLCHFKVVS